MKNLSNNIIKNWLKALSTILLILWSVVSFANANNVNDSLKLRTGIKQNITNTIVDTLSGPSVTLMEVRAGQVNIRSQYIKPRTVQKPSYTHVDSLYNDLKNDYRSVITFILAYKLAEKKTENLIKAKAYLSIPISILLWLILIWIGINRQDKILINVACILLIVSIIGTVIVLPILLQGFLLAPM